jgi:release factor glutamine methyltransferase
VLANPPYVAEGTTLQPEWEEHHPRLAIYAGDDGFGVIRGMVELAARLLRPGGGVAIEHDVSQTERLLDLLLQAHDAFTCVANCTEHRGQTRHITARKRLGEDKRGI